MEVIVFKVQKPESVNARKMIPFDLNENSTISTLNTNTLEQLNFKFVNIWQVSIKVFAEWYPQMAI